MTSCHSVLFFKNHSQSGLMNPFGCISSLTEGDIGLLFDLYTCITFVYLVCLERIAYFSRGQRETLLFHRKIRVVASWLWVEFILLISTVTCQRKGKVIKGADVLDGISVDLGRGSDGAWSSSHLCAGLSLSLFWVRKHIVWEIPVCWALDFIHVETESPWSVPSRRKARAAISAAYDSRNILDFRWWYLWWATYLEIPKIGK